MTTHRSFAAVGSALQASALVRLADRIASAVEDAWARSISVRAMRNARARFDTLGPSSRIRAVAVLVSTAAAGHLFLLLFVGPQVAPATPRILWVTVAAASAVVAMFAPAIAASWQASTIGTVIARVHMKADATGQSGEARRS